MAKSSKARPRNPHVLDLIKKREFMIGVVTIVAFALVLGSYVFRQAKTDRNVARNIESEIRVESPVPTKSSNQESQNMEASLTVKRTKNPLNKITKLADTGSSESTVARNGDNFWNISKRVCGTGEYAEAIRAYNGYQYKALQPGDTIEVVCSY